MLMIISVNVEKGFVKTECPFVIRILSKTGLKEDFINLMKDICENTKLPLSLKVITEHFFSKIGEQHEDIFDDFC